MRNYGRPAGVVTPRHQRVAVGRPFSLAATPFGHGHESLLSVSSHLFHLTRIAVGGRATFLIPNS